MPSTKSTFGKIPAFNKSSYNDTAVVAPAITVPELIVSFSPAWSYVMTDHQCNGMKLQASFIGPVHENKACRIGASRFHHGTARMGSVRPPVSQLHGPRGAGRHARAGCRWFEDRGGDVPFQWFIITKPKTKQQQQQPQKHTFYKSCPEEPLKAP